MCLWMLSLLMPGWQLAKQGAAGVYQIWPCLTVDYSPWSQHSAVQPSWSSGVIRSFPVIPINAIQARSTTSASQANFKSLKSLVSFSPCSALPWWQRILVPIPSNLWQRRGGNQLTQGLRESWRNASRRTSLILISNAQNVHLVAKRVFTTASVYSFQTISTVFNHHHSNWDSWSACWSWENITNIIGPLPVAWPRRCR